MQFEQAAGVVGQVDAVSGIDPLLIAAAVVVVLVVVAVTSWTFLRFRRSPGERFQKALAGSEEVAILTHPNPDPDAMACAMGAARIAEFAGVDATIQYAGQIRHQENRAFRTVLEFEAEQIEAKSDVACDDVVLVDHNVPRGFPGAEGVEPIAVVDHHPGNGVGTRFTDVRPERGSCASIIADYFQDLGADRYGPEDTPPEDGGLYVDAPLATGLVFGLQSDTNRLTEGATQADFDACSYLYPSIDSDLLERIADPEVTAETLDVKARAIQNRQIDGSFAVSHVGEITDADTIPQSADELVRLEGVGAVVVMGERDGVLHLSGRSRDDRVHMGEALEAAVESVPMASAGGHARMGGGQLSIDHMEGIGPSAGMDVPQLTERLFDCLRGDV
ncbi:phosphoesterase RecJ domain protein [Salinarchaeum sp. Harcht-Bsk1]|uniref:DHH family phosphoesterase n=1 Tax=Salinarchaeum sp. Harcht-Bsk1 TaxID=1333523 RepID=UPI0003422D7C|nr:bifunctional oligoribonuclease/PAP phosphatase NrnA [Salinarchaeum sp. Harcht-Bsk1]AGN02042.1 phosphoesterase RecJ domain protein [Salinarchaeum sp. Harcht-Bsk1]